MAFRLDRRRGLQTVLIRGASNAARIKKIDILKRRYRDLRKERKEQQKNEKMDEGLGITRSDVTH